MYFDYYLKFDSEEQAKDLLYTTKTDGELEYLQSKYLAIDTIGIIYKPTGVMLSNEFGEFPEMAPIPGWHVNVRNDIAVPELEQYSVYPDSPYRVWA